MNIIIAFIGMIVNDLALGLLVVFLLLFVVMIIATLVAAIICTPKLFSIVYLGHQEIKEKEIIKCNDIIKEKPLM